MLTLAIGSSGGICASNSGSMGASPALLPFASMAGISMQRQVKQTLDAQAKLDCRSRERVLATALAAGRGAPLHVFVQPDCQRAPGFDRGVVRSPNGGLVAGLWTFGFTHASRLTAQWCLFLKQSRTDNGSILF